MIRVAIAGTGRMGQAIAAGLEQHDDMELVGLWGRGDDLDTLVSNSDVVIDFSLPDGTVKVLEAASRHGKALVCGVSGLNDEQMAGLDDVAARIGVVYDRNMSLGVAVLERSVREAAASLGMDFAVKIAEVHHVHKKDAPSGTALKLGEAWGNYTGRELCEWRERGARSDTGDEPIRDKRQKESGPCREVEGGQRDNTGSNRSGGDLVDISGEWKELARLHRREHNSNNRLIRSGIPSIGREMVLY